MRTKPSRRRTVRRDGPEPVDVHVGQRLRLARILAGVSQGDLGDGIGISFQAVQKYETGENRISASRLYRAARILARPVTYFFDEIDDAYVAEAAQSFSGEEIDMVRFYRQLSDDKLRRHLMEMMKLVAKGARPKVK